MSKKKEFKFSLGDCVERTKDSLKKSKPCTKWGFVVKLWYNRSTPVITYKNPVTGKSCFCGQDWLQSKNCGDESFCNCSCSHNCCSCNCNDQNRPKPKFKIGQEVMTAFKISHISNHKNHVGIVLSREWEPGHPSWFYAVEMCSKDNKKIRIHAERLFRSV